MRLENCCHIWEVTYESLDDGHRISCGEYFSSMHDAEAFARTFNGGKDAKAIQADLWHDLLAPGERRYYRFEGSHPVEVFVDRVKTREQALKKLSRSERKALGL